jgi:hypothetical protein
VGSVVDKVALVQVLGAFTKLRKETVSFVMSVYTSAWNNSAPTRHIVMKNLSRKLRFHYIMTRIMAMCSED